MFHHRASHYLLLALVWAITSLPNLGDPLLWDIDEGLNATAAAEMLESGNFIVPTFNYQLRSAKPVLLYWLQCGAYQLLGVNELSARLPSAVAVLLTTWLVYELGRWMFDRLTAFLAGLILVSCVSVQGAAHFANPDGLLLLFTTATIGFYWLAWQRASGWIVASAAAAALAVLAKGPVGLLLPGAIVVLFLLWQRQLRRLFCPYLGEAILVFLLLALPWYVWVSVETKGVWLREFWFTHHLQRAGRPMENHSGSPLYYVGILMVGLFPWVIFLGPTVWYAVRRSVTGSSSSETANGQQAAIRLLVCWFAVVFVFFSLMQTKLPNYILPLYPSLTLLTARTLTDWLRGDYRLPVWVMPLALGCLAISGIGVSLALLVVGGTISTPLLRGHVFPELGAWTWLGAVPLMGAVVAAWMLGRGQRNGFVAAVAVTAVVFVSLVTGGALSAMNGYKANAALAAALPEDQLRQDIRLGASAYFQPSIVFYCRREVRKVDVPESALEFLRRPLPAYLFVSEPQWRILEARVPTGTVVLARRPDLYSGRHILVVANPAAGSSLAAREQTSAR